MTRGELVLISGKDPREPGGHESYVRAHGLAAMRIGFEPHIFFGASVNGTEHADFGVIHRVRVPRRRTPPVLLQAPLPTHIPLLARGVASFLACQRGPHIIHSFGSFAGAGVWASRALARHGIQATPVASAYATRAYEIGAMRAIGVHHGLGNRVRYRLWHEWVVRVDNSVEGWGYLRSSVVLVNYDSVRRLLGRAYGSGLNVQRIPYAAPDAFAATAASAAKPGQHSGPMIISLSRQDPRKGVDLLVLALREVANAGIPFRACLVGPGKLLSSHRRLVTRLGLDEQVALPGAVPDVAPYLSAADIFVLPSLREASGSVAVLEALRASKPVIASACDGLPEDLVHEENALLVTPGEVASLTDALKRLLTDGGLRARLATNARETYEQRFSAEAFVAALAEVYERQLNRAQVSAVANSASSS